MMLKKSETKNNGLFQPKAALLFFLTVMPLISAEMIMIKGGELRSPLSNKKVVLINNFFIDETAVTNREYALFVAQNQQWKKNHVLKIFSDKRYLEHWSNSENVGNSDLEDSPVTNVSWFAARAYCIWNEKRLPMADEWEYVGNSKPVNYAGDLKKYILEWYSKPTLETTPHIKSTFKNEMGVWDMHGLIWEWVDDYNTYFFTGESRADSALEKLMFCGSGSLGFSDASDYALFMRLAFRSSLQAAYTTRNLGFRCAR